MKHSFLFACLLIVAATIHAQENKVQTPPVRTTDVAKAPSGNAVQMSPTKTADNAKPLAAASAVQAVPIKTADNSKLQTATAVQAVPIKTADNSKLQTVTAVQTVPMKTTDQVQQSKPSQLGPVKNTDGGGSSSAISPSQKKINMPANSKLPSSISADNAKEQLQKKGDTTLLPAHL